MSSFASRGTARGYIGKNGGIGTRIVNDNRRPIYIVYILDKSGSMSGISTIINEDGEVVQISKIDQLNMGVKKLIKTLKEFEANNPLYKIYLQIIELDSYGKAVFSEFQPISRGFEEITFEADGCTELRASLSTLKTYISPKYLKDERAGREDKGYNKAVSVILMSDGWPTDVNGIEQTGPAYRGVVDEFKKYLRDMDYARNVDLYSMAVGDDACEDMLRYFSDGDEDLGDRSRFYRVEECESLANALDFVTRATLAHHTTVPVPIDDDEYSDDEENDDVETENGDDVTEDRLDSASPEQFIFDDNSVSDGDEDDSDDKLSDLFDGLDE
jgi:uncharacterized protein YegL